MADNSSEEPTDNSSQKSSRRSENSGLVDEAFERRAGVGRRFSTAAERALFDELDALLANHNKEQVNELFTLIRKPFYDEAGFLISGPTSSNTSNEFLDDVIAEMAASGTHYDVARVSPLDVGKLNGAYDATVVNEILERYKNILYRNLDITLSDSDVTAVADATSLLIFVAAQSEAVSERHQTKLFIESVHALANALGDAMDRHNVDQDLSGPSITLMGYTAEAISSMANDSKAAAKFKDNVRGHGSGPSNVAVARPNGVGVFSTLAKYGLTSDASDSYDVAEGDESSFDTRSFESNFVSAYFAERRQEIDNLMESWGVQIDDWTAAKLKAFITKHGDEPIDPVMGIYGRGVREGLLQSAIDQLGPGERAAYVEIDISNLGEINRTIGVKEADRLLAEFTSMTELALLTVKGVTFEMTRHGGDELGVVAIFANAAAEQRFNEVVKKLPKMFNDLVKDITYSTPESIEKRLMDVMHPKHGQVVNGIKQWRAKGMGIKIAGAVFTSGAKVEDIVATTAKKIETIKNMPKVMADLGNHVIVAKAKKPSTAFGAPKPGQGPGGTVAAIRDFGAGQTLGSTGRPNRPGPLDRFGPSNRMF